MSRDVQIRRYLLGDLPEVDSQRLDEELFTSDDRFSEILAAEDDLIEEFLQRKLDIRDRERFETRFLSTERGRRKVAMASAISNASRTQPVERSERMRAWLRPLAIAAAIAVVAIGAGVLRETIETRREVKELASEVVRLRTATVNRPEPLPQSGTVFPIVLHALERGSSSAAIVLPADAAADLWLVLPSDDYRIYIAELQSVDGQTLATAQSLRSQAINGRRAVVFRLPPASLAPATYVVALSGEKGDRSSEPVEDFSFTVRRP